MSVINKRIKTTNYLYSKIKVYPRYTRPKIKIYNLLHNFNNSMTYVVGSPTTFVSLILWAKIKQTSSTKSKISSSSMQDTHSLMTWKEHTPYTLIVGVGGARVGKNNSTIFPRSVDVRAYSSTSIKLLELRTIILVVFTVVHSGGTCWIFFLLNERSSDLLELSIKE